MTWTERVWKFAARPVRARAGDLADEVSEWRSTLIEAVELLDELTEALESWTGADSKDEREEALEEVDSLLFTVREALAALSQSAGAFNGEA